MTRPLTLALLDAPYLGAEDRHHPPAPLRPRRDAEGWEPEGYVFEERTWGEMDADEGADLGRDSHPDAEAPACARCCGTGQEIDLSSGELDSCRDCGGTGLREPWRDPDYAEAHGLCSGCGISTHLSPEAGSCAVCDARIEAGAGEDDAPQASNGGGWDDDPDPGDGGGWPAPYCGGFARAEPSYTAPDGTARILPPGIPEDGCPCTAFSAFRCAADRGEIVCACPCHQAPGEQRVVRAVGGVA